MRDFLNVEKFNKLWVNLWENAHVLLCERTSVLFVKMTEFRETVHNASTCFLSATFR